MARSCLNNKSLKDYSMDENSKIIVLLALKGGNLEIKEENDRMKEEIREMRKLSQELKISIDISQKSKSQIQSEGSFLNFLGSEDEKEIKIKNNNNNNNNNRNVKSITKLKSVKVFDGSEEFKEWIKPFKLQMCKYDDETKLITLIHYLSDKLILTLADLGPEISSDFETLCSFLIQEFRKSEVG